ncbi:MAG: radical SAM protein, partial [Anaeromyxobacteraceae bacterium]|nr:radical SAM protein [Anaeromyxobacteraceae bacterium]
GVTYRCNQRCAFCALEGLAAEVPAERVLEALRASRAKGAARLVLTGGEPTLAPHLADLVREARRLGYQEVELQSNAILLDRPGAAARLAAAGLTHAQVSLHAADPEVSDRLTGAPGTQVRTVAGVRALLEAGVQVVVNHLLFRDNAHLLTAFVELAAARWAGAGARLTLQFHTPRDEFRSREEALRHVARYRELAVPLRAAVDRARQLGLEVRDLQDPTGLPSLCVLDADERYLGPIRPQALAPRAHAAERGWFTRVGACAACGLADACLGVPAAYLALHGDEEFHPLPGRVA